MKKGSEYPIELGSIGYVSHIWYDMKYRVDPEGEYHVCKIKLDIIEEVPLGILPDY